MKYRKTGGDYRVHVQIHNKGDETKVTLRLETKLGLISLHEQTYELTKLDLLLEEEFKPVIREIVKDMESV